MHGGVRLSMAGAREEIGATDVGEGATGAVAGDDTDDQQGGAALPLILPLFLRPALA